jgi:hypothetical protein
MSQYYRASKKNLVLLSHSETKCSESIHFFSCCVAIKTYMWRWTLCWCLPYRRVLFRILDAELTAEIYVVWSTPSRFGFLISVSMQSTIFLDVMSEIYRHFWVACCPHLRNQTVSSQTTGHHIPAVHKHGLVQRFEIKDLLTASGRCQMEMGRSCTEGLTLFLGSRFGQADAL